MSNSDGEEPLQLEWLPGRYAVCRLEADAQIPAWMSEAFQRAGPSSARSETFSSITRTDRELSIVCDEAIVPNGVRAERDFAALRVVGTLDFSLTGVIARLTVPLADAGVPVFVVSTFETDYLLIRRQDADHAIDVMQQTGFRVQELSSSDT